MIFLQLPISDSCHHKGDLQRSSSGLIGKPLQTKSQLHTMGSETHHFQSRRSVILWLARHESMFNSQPEKIAPSNHTSYFPWTYKVVCANIIHWIITMNFKHDTILRKRKTFIWIHFFFLVFVKSNKRFFWVYILQCSEDELLSCSEPTLRVICCSSTMRSI